MSNRELVMKLLGTLPDYKIGYVLAYLQGMTADEDAEDRYCEMLLSAYDNDPDKGQLVTLEDAARECGVDLSEL